MKRILLISGLMLLFVAGALAQPVLNVSSVPSIGSSYVEYECDTTAVSDGTSGANQSWDYSDLVVSDDEPPYMFTVEKPDQGERSEEFPDADFAQVFYDGSVYYKLENSQLIRLGVGYDEGIEKLDDLSVIMKYPFTYNDSFEDDYSGTITTDTEEGPVTINRNGSYSVEADGYGTLKMPFGTFNNVLRMKLIQETRDETPSFMPGTDPMIVVDYIVSYSYFLESNSFPILTISHSVVTYENSPFPLDPEHYNSVSYIEFDAVVSEKPTVPEMLSPNNAATMLQQPVTFLWFESELGGIIQKNNDKTQEDIIYTLEVTTDPTFSEESEIVQKTIETSLELNNFEPGETYYWRVSAEYKEEVSEWSEPWSFSISEEVVEQPDPPTLLTPENGAVDISLTPTFTWQDSDGILEWSFIITIVTEDDEEIIYLENSLTEPQHTVTMALEPNTTYYWGVRGYDGNNWSEWAEAYEFTTEDLTSVKDILNADRVKISPNPINSVMSIKFNSLVNSTAKVSILDLSGNNVIKFDNQAISEGSNQLNLDVNALNSGVYFLVITGNNFNLSQKIIISK